jgi:hypothetical protein
VERVLELLPDPFTRRNYERLMRVSAWTSGKFVRELERRGRRRWTTGPRPFDAGSQLRCWVLLEPALLTER